VPGSCVPRYPTTPHFTTYAVNTAFAQSGRNQALVFSESLFSGYISQHGDE
jgi:hypothetical protein